MSYNTGEEYEKVLEESYLHPTYIDGLEIPFPTIKGTSQKQEWYAENLREAYVRNHWERFVELEEIMQLENDQRIRQENYYDGEHEESFDEVYSEAESACLLGVNAGRIISVLKEALYSE